MHVGVKRCTGAPNNKLKRQGEAEKALKASWDYQERVLGISHPLKENRGIETLEDKIRKGT